MKWRNAVAERVDLEDQLDPEYVRRRVCARLLAPCLPVRYSWLDAVSISSIQKKNFNTQAFNADISGCKHQNSSFVAMQTLEPKGRLQIDDAMVRECMTTKD